jgi:hypothetical protein
MRTVVPAPGVLRIERSAEMSAARSFMPAMPAPRPAGVSAPDIPPPSSGTSHHSTASEPPARTATRLGSG